MANCNCIIYVSRNPTGSFKDRSMTVGVSKALELGVDTVVTASSGNAAASLAAYSAKAGIKCFAFVLEFASPAKNDQIHFHMNMIALKIFTHLLRVVYS
jgi:threonine synthase